MSAVVPPSGDDDSQYRIEATGGFREPRTRVLKHGDTFAVFNPFGDIGGDSGCPDGLYHNDTRYLSQLELRLNGDRPLLLSANPGEDNALLTVDLANPDTADADGGALHRELPTAWCCATAVSTAWNATPACASSRRRTASTPAARISC
jgi:hypothetical protein